MYCFISSYITSFTIVITIFTISDYLFYKYATMKVISPVYAATDLEIVRMFDALGLKDHALSLAKRLGEVYAKYGGGTW